MDYLISVSLGEAILKGKNRRYFEDKQVEGIKRAIEDIGYDEIYKEQAKIYIKAEKDKFERLIPRLEKVFGIVYISPCIKCDKDIESIKRAIDKLILDSDMDKRDTTFKVHTTRGDKSYEYKSPEINMMMGGYILKNYNNFSVDVHNPKHYIYIDIKQNAYVYTEKIKAQGGMPPGTNGSAILMLSGGIDSPVAGYMMAKRGIKLKAVYFHSYPFTSERAEKKVEELASIVARYAGQIKLYSINVLEIQKAINEHCPEREGTIHLRRFMVRLSERICDIEKADALITGENLGQVASQTIDALKVTDSTTKKLIFRPLIGMDKQEIIDIAKEIETYEESIKPYEDCCTIFLPKHPVLKPEIKKIEESESKLDIETLVENAMNTAKVKIIK